MAADALREHAPHYAFVSSLSVYDDLARTGQDETGHLATIDDPTTEEITETSYGALKVLAEGEVERVFGDRALILRPGYIAGPYDSLGRMPFWLERMARGGEVLAPEGPDVPVQLIDARDIARFALALAELGSGGTFNLCAPQEPYAYGDVLATASRVTGGAPAELTWASADFLIEHELDRWEAFPWWAPPAEVAFSRFDASRALGEGLEVRPLEETFRDCWTWMRSLPEPPLREDRGLPPERERELLAAWHARSG
jgi:2'-hydroxyisoflavone reductase